MAKIKPHFHKCMECGKEWVCKRKNMCEDVVNDPDHRCRNKSMGLCKGRKPCRYAQSLCAMKGNRISICDACFKGY
jgi:hypothetical protein